MRGSSIGAALAGVWGVAGLVACGGEEGGRTSATTTPTSITVADTGIDPSGAGTASGGADDGVDSTVGGAKFDLGADTDGPPDSGPGTECEPNLATTIRDFQSSHPDFEGTIAVDPGIVQTMLGGDGKPVYAGGSAGTTSGAANFDQWYRDVAGVNMTLPSMITLTDQGNGSFVFDSAAFFPIDGQGFGDEGNPHNYHFTLEMHTQFTYEGGEVFTFRGDDDLFTFVNGRLAIDLGGVHGPLMGTVDFDAQAAALGITPGNTYDIDFFFAERHTSESNFRIETTIGCFHPPG